jgi:hypothetical protein
MASIKKHIYDFVILFIGITAAFYVENFRQDLGDKEDLRKYLIGLTDDLKSDSLIYASTKVTLIKSIQSIDSLIVLSENDNADNSTKIRLLAISTLLIYDVGVDNNINYKALVNSGQLKLIEDIDYRKHLNDYYRSSEVWLKNYENEFQTFRTNEFFPFLNGQINYGDFKWDGELKISKNVTTDTKVFNTMEFKNYLHRNRQFLHDFTTTMDELMLSNDDILKRTRSKLD